jgi:CubicO group peptidase (beta-lactamase class C family)
MWHCGSPVYTLRFRFPEPGTYLATFRKLHRGPDPPSERRITFHVEDSGAGAEDLTIDPIHREETGTIRVAAGRNVVLRWKGIGGRSPAWARKYEWRFASIEVPEPAGKTVSPPEMSLHVASLVGNLDALKKHVEAGSDLNEKDAFGSTPLVIASTFGRTEAARALIEAGADPEIRNGEGSPPLHIAVFFARTGIVEALLARGANRYARNRAGATAFDIAASPFDDDREIYDRIGAALAPLGLKLDCMRIRKTRPGLAESLRAPPEDLAGVESTPAPGEGWRVSTPAEQGLDPALVADLYRHAADMEKLLGLLVVKNGHLVAEGYFNEGAIGRKALVQSVTKSYTSALVGIAIHQGHLPGVERKMADFFPELAGRIRDPRKREITIRHMLQMRAGYPWEESSKELFEILYQGFRPSHLVDFPLLHDPGTEFAYSNLTSHLLAVIVARACGKDFKAYAQETLFSPLGVEVGDPWWRDLEGNYIGHGGMRFTARDAAKFGLLFLDDGKFEGKRIVPADWVRDSMQTYIRNVSTGAPTSGKLGRYFRSVGYGYQWWSARVGDHHLHYAAGHGGQLIVLLEEHDMIIVVLSDPFLGKHGDEAWTHEQANFNLVGKFIRSLPKKE